MADHVRFQADGMDSFLGEFAYEQAVPQDHFLRKLQAVVPWERYTRRLLRWYQGKGISGRPPYDPAVILKMLLLSYLHNLSERQIEVAVNDSISMKWFLGLTIDRPAPDHSTLTEFKARLLQNGKLEGLDELLAQIVEIALEAGVKFGSIQVMDSVHTVANVNTAKDEHRRRGGQRPRDPSAHWGVKHSKRVKKPDGETETQKEYFFGYKAHVSMNAETGLITSIRVTAGNAPDGKQMPALLSRDQALHLPIDTVAADKAYDDTLNHFLLWSQDLYSAIRLNTYRTEKKDDNKEIWVALKATPQYQSGCRVRYTIERKFGEAKENHGLRRSRYLGLLRYAFQAIMTALALNLKRIVKLLTATSFKGQATVAA